MNTTDLQKLQQEWYDENAPLGRKLGYPECCIREFCAQPPALLKGRRPTRVDKDRYMAACVDGVFTGFIPCAWHAGEILKGTITLASIIHNRNPLFLNFLPFSE